MIDDDTEMLELLESAMVSTRHLIDGLTPQMWHVSTPCEAMDVAALVQHLLGGLDEFAAIPAGGDDAAVAADPEGAPLVEHREAPAAYRASCDRLVAAWSAPGVIGRFYPMPWGETPGAMLMGFMVIEQVTHGWDLARASAQHPPHGDEVAEATLALAQAYDDEAIRVPGMFGPAVAVAADGAAIDRLAGFLGRRP